MIFILRAVDRPPQAIVGPTGDGRLIVRPLDASVTRAVKIAFYAARSLSWVRFFGQSSPSKEYPPENLAEFRP
jgi:hypothetical protein